MPRALVSVLSADLANSTDLLLRAGHEQAQRILEACHRLLERCVNAHNGRDVGWLGDSLMAMFDSPSDAARCAVAMQQSASRPIAGERLALRIGLDVGDCVREERHCFGAPVVMARHLCTAATRRQILCNAPLVELLAGQSAFRFRDCDPSVLASGSDTIRVSELLYRHDHPTALLAHTPFVGRTREIDRLRATLERTTSGSGGLVLLTGEPGIGKTRIMEEFSEGARVAGARVLVGRCCEGEARRPYGPFVEALGEHVRTVRLEELREDLGSGAAPLARLLPSLLERVPDLPEPAPLQPDEERARLLDAVTQWLIALSARAPVVLILDDLHWADAASVALLRHVARFLTRHRLLVLVAYRDNEVTSEHPLTDTIRALPSETRCEHVSLHGLDRTEVGQLLDLVADQKVPEALVQAITAETSGNPFFIREMLLIHDNYSGLSTTTILAGAVPG